MDASVIITVRDKQRAEEINKSVLADKLCVNNITIFYKIGYSSIFKAVKSAIDDDLKSVDLNHKVIYMHDDVDILSSYETMSYCLSVLEEPKVGFIGVAGTKLLRQSGIWWDGISSPQHGTHLSPLAGLVYHGKGLNKDMYPTYYGHNNNVRVVVLDGCFLAATLKTWRTISLTKPREYTGDWDFYDINWTFQAHLRGLENRVVPLTILHGSEGHIKGKDGWHKNKAAFLGKYLNKLPASVN